MRDAEAFNILLFHHNLMIFWALGNVLYFLSQFQWYGLFSCWGSFQETNLLELREHLLTYFICWMFNFSVTVIKNLLKALAMFLGSFNFSSFTSNEGTCSTECTFSLSFFTMFHVVVILLLGFAISLLQCCFLASFMTFHRILQYLIQCAFGSLLFLLKVYKLLLWLQYIFIPCVIQSFLSFILLCLTGKLAWKMFKKVHRNGLKIWLGSVSI